MKLSDKLYDVLKWLTLLVIPAITTLYVAISAIWGLPYGGEVAQTGGAVCTCLGTILGISSAKYNRGNTDEKEDSAPTDI